MLTAAQTTVATAIRPVGFGYSTRLTMSQATPTTSARVRAKGSSSRTTETTVSAAKGIGMPSNMPSREVVTEKRASRSTPASSTATAPTTVSHRWEPSPTSPQTTTK